VQFDGTTGELEDAGAICGSGGGGATLQTNGTNNHSQVLFNAETSTANSVGLTVTPSNPSGGIEKWEITGSSYTGNAATATALASYTNYSVYGSGSGVGAWITPTANSQCLESASSSYASHTPSFVTCPSGGPGTGTLYYLPYWSSTTVLGSIADQVTGQLPVAANGGPPAFASPGMVEGAAGTPVTSTPYKMQCDSSTAIIDRATFIVAGSGSSVFIAPDPSDTGCGSGFLFALINESGSTITVNRETSATMNVVNGSLISSSLTTFPMSSGAFSTFNSDGINWHVRLSGGNLGNVTASSLVASGIVDGQTPVTIVTTSAVTVGTTYSTSYFFNQNAIAAQAVGFNLPTAVAGKQFCFANTNNGSAATTGGLQINTSASGQHIDYNGSLSASGGFVTSSGTSVDAACVAGENSTTWRLYVQGGTWALH
jgi:hypothetical protein